MKSLRELYRIGKGPSSSHTMGPASAAAMFRAEAPDAVRYRVELYGSLAATGRGHMTDRAVISELGEDRTEVVWKPEIVPSFHPNGLRIFAYDAAGEVIKKQDYYSIGGGAVSVDGGSVGGEEVYGFADMREVLAHCNGEGTPIWAVVDEFEDPGVWTHLSDVLTTMDAAIERGLEADGALPGGLNLPRRARSTSSDGVSVPSLAVEWTWQSTIMTQWRRSEAPSSGRAAPPSSPRPEAADRVRCWISEC